MSPHAEYRLMALGGLLVALDLALATLLLWRLAPRSGWQLAAAGAFGAIAPDALQGAERALHVDVTLSWHIANHTSIAWPLWAGALTQVAVLAVCALALMRLRRRS